MSGTQLNRIVIQHLDGARKGELETFIQTTVSIGRSGDCDLVFVNEKSTSSHHAVLRQRESSIELLDTQSTSGTFVNDVRIERAVLKDGDVVRFGVLGPKVKIGLNAAQDGQVGTHAPLPLQPLPLQASVGNTSPASAVSQVHLERVENSSNTLSNNWPVVRTALMFYAGGSVAAIGVVNTVIDLYHLDVRWFTIFLILMAGGLVSTTVEAWYRGTPGTQKIRLWEVLVHLAIIALCVGISALVWK